jgi:hypothetical protein
MLRSGRVKDRRGEGAPEEKNKQNEDKEDDNE